MIELSLQGLADVIGGEPGMPLDPDIPITGVCIDSRQVRPGDLFIPLPGEQVDGHRFIAAAMAAGAAGYLCDAEHASIAQEIPGAVLVDDPLDALTGLGAWVRDEVNPTVIAVTGSNGKTTTKDLIAAAIGGSRRTVANPGSFNNEIGLPLTLCMLAADTEVLVCEIGSRGIGHIADVMPMLRPDVAVITSIAAAHIGEFGSLEAILQAKGELLEGLVDDGVAIIPQSVAHADGIAGRAPDRVVTFAATGAAVDTADFVPSRVELDAQGHARMDVEGISLRVPVAGLHNASNTMAALAAAVAVDVPLPAAAAGLEAAAVSRWRMEVGTSTAGIIVVNDAYNANEHSMVAALDTVASMATTGRRWAILGFMAELGPETGPSHAAVGQHVAATGFDELIVVEARAEGIADGAREGGFRGRIRLAADAGIAAALAAEELTPGDVVLVKASRSAGLERAAQALLEFRAHDHPNGPSEGSLS